MFPSIENSDGDRILTRIKMFPSIENSDEDRILTKICLSQIVVLLPSQVEIFVTLAKPMPTIRISQYRVGCASTKSYPRRNTHKT
jgi:hypothetical protein